MPAWHQLAGEYKDQWRPLDEVINLTTTRKHGRIELHPDPSAFVQQLTPGSSVMYLRDEILTDVRAVGTLVLASTSPQRLKEFEDMEVLVRMHRTWTDDPTVCITRNEKGSTPCLPQGRQGWREWWNHCLAKQELEDRMAAMKV